MTSTHSMNARKCVHAQKSYPTQAFAHESSKVGGKGRRETGKRGQEADEKKGSPTKQKHIGVTKNKAYLGTAKANKVGEEHELPLATECDSSPLTANKHYKVDSRNLLVYLTQSITRCRPSKGRRCIPDVDL